LATVVAALACFTPSKLYAEGAGTITAIKHRSVKTSRSSMSTSFEEEEEEENKDDEGRRFSG
jgi:hypothetical protein